MTEIIVQVIASAGGASVAVILIVKYLGSILRDSVSKGVEASYAKQLTAFQADLDVRVAQAKELHSAQMVLYTEITAVLFDLSVAANALWREASLDNLQVFAQQLHSASVVVGRKRILLDPDLRKDLLSLVQALEDYRIGKTTLAELRSFKGEAPQHRVDRVINDNRERLRRLVELIGDVDAAIDTRLGRTLKPARQQES